MHCLLVHLKTEKCTKCLTFRIWTMDWSGKITLELGCQMLTCFIRMRRRRLICFCILSTDWKPDIQPKIDKTVKQFFKFESWYYFVGRVFCEAVLCTAEALIGHIQTIIFLSSSGSWLKLSRSTSLGKKIMQGCDNQVSGWLMSLRVWAKWFHLSYGIYSARFF